jgi:hypothetical protein
LVLVFPLILVVSSPTARSQGTTGSDDHLSWTEEYSLIVTANTTLEETNQTVDFIGANGGQVAIVVSPRLLLGWAPRELIGQAGIQSIHRRAVDTTAFQQDADEADAVEFFNLVASGAWRENKRGLSDHQREVEYGADAFDGPPSSGGFRGNGPDLLGASSPGNADVMAGRANFNAIFVESNNFVFWPFDPDPNLYTWSCADVSTIVSEISASLSFWSSRAGNYGVPLTWIASYHRPPQCFGGTTNVVTFFEPILHAQSQDGLWINQIMCNFGNCSGDKFARTNVFNSARRVATGANWATTSFIGYNPSPAPTTFTDGYFAYAYRSGNYSQLLYRNDGWAVSQYDLVNAHETGHLFGTFDEYASSGCANCFSGDGLSKNVVNGNCANCGDPSVPCIMRSNEVALCGYTPGQLGWGLDINYARTSRTSAFIEKTNFTPGQAIRYHINVDVPGRTGECVTVRSRWYRQFQANVTQAESFVSPCLVQTGGSWNIWLDRTVPATAQFGESVFEVQLEFVYATSPNAYGKGVRASQRGRFFVLPGGANPTVAFEAPLEPPQAAAQELPRP